MRELSMLEIEQVSGGRLHLERGVPYFAAAMTLGQLAYGSGWALAAVGTAAGMPIVLGAIVGLSVAGGFVSMFD